MKDFRAAAVGMCTPGQIKDIHMPICLSHQHHLFMLNVKVRFVLVALGVTVKKGGLIYSFRLCVIVNQSRLVVQSQCSKAPSGSSVSFKLIFHSFRFTLLFNNL